MKNHRSFWASAALCLSLGLGYTSLAYCADYPTKPIRLVVPFAPGGSTDVIARALAEKLTDYFGHPVVVDNRGGGGGVIGAEIAVRATPDGYTLIFVSGSYATNAALRPLRFDPINDIVPINLTCETGYLIGVFPGLKISSPRDLVALAKAKPGGINYGSAGQGSLAHLATELFSMYAGIKLTHVPYKGTGPALIDLIGGQIQVVFGGVPGLLPHHKANRLRAIGITTAKRSNALPDVPAVAETLPGYEAPLWFGFWGPKGLSGAVVKRWNAAIDHTLRLPDVRERMAREALEAIGGDPKRFRNVIKSDIEKWRKVAKQGNISLGN